MLRFFLEYHKYFFSFLSVMLPTEIFVARINKIKDLNFLIKKIVIFY